MRQDTDTEKPWYVFMAIRKNDDDENIKDVLVQTLRDVTRGNDASRSKNSEREKHRKRSNGHRVVLKMSQNPLHDIDVMNQNVSAYAITHDEEQLSKEMYDLINSPPDELCKHGAGGERSVKRLRKRGTGKSCSYKLTQQAGPFHKRTQAEAVLHMWQDRSRGEIPRAALGDVLGEIEGVEMAGHMDDIFNSGCLYWNVVYIENRWQLVRYEKPLF